MIKLTTDDSKGKTPEVAYPSIRKYELDRRERAQESDASAAVGQQSGWLHDGRSIDGA